MTYLESTTNSTGEHRVQFSTVVEFDNASLGTIVAPSNEISTNKDCWNGCSTNYVCHFGPNSFAVCHLIKFDNVIFDILLAVKDRLGLDAKGSGSETKHQYGMTTNEAIESGSNSGLIVIASEASDEGFLAFVERTVTGQDVLNRIGYLSVPNFGGIVIVVVVGHVKNSSSDGLGISGGSDKSSRLLNHQQQGCKCSGSKGYHGKLE